MTESNGRFTRFRMVYRGVAICALNFLVLLALFNLGLWAAHSIVDYSRRFPTGRTADYRGYSSHLLDAAYPGWDARERDLLLLETRTRPFRCNAFTHYAESAFSGRYVNVDQAGFRCNGAPPIWPPPKDSLVVFVFGGSTTFGYGVSDSETIPARLQEALARSLGREGANLQVYNFGQGSFYSSQELILFSTLLRAGHIPDAAVFIDGWNEWDHSDHPLNIGICNPSPWLPSSSLIVSLPMVRFGRSMRYRLALTGAEEEAASEARQRGAEIGEVVERWPRAVAQSKAIAEQFGVIPLFVWQPVSVYHYDLKSHIFASALNPAQREGIRSGYEKMAKVLVPLGQEIPILDLADMQLGDNRPLYVDRCHYGPMLSSEIAERIAVHLAAAMARRTQLPDLVSKGSTQPVRL